MKPVPYLSNLTPLRGIAAMLTVIFHVNLFLGNGLAPTGSTMLISRMYLMVDFFFILSGFIMCHVYGNLFTVSVKKKDFKKFTIARFSRVYPLHFVTLMYVILLFFVSSRLGIPEIQSIQIADNWYTVITNLLLLQSMNLHNWFTWVHASWSISTEWWAYMLFPFLVRPFMKLGSTARLMVCLACFGGYLCITYFLVPLVTVPPEISFARIDPTLLSVNVAYQYGFVRCLCGFVLGMMMYQGFTIEWAKNILGNGLTMLMLALAIFTCMHFGLPDVITLSFFPFLLLAGAYGSAGINKILNLKALQRLGDWSFSIYLVHQPLLYTVTNVMLHFNPALANSASSGPPPAPDILQSWITCAIFIALVLLISYLTYRFVENPARHRINAKVV